MLSQKIIYIMSVQTVYSQSKDHILSGHHNVPSVGSLLYEHVQTICCIQLHTTKHVLVPNVWHCTKESTHGSVPPMSWTKATKRADNLQPFGNTVFSLTHKVAIDLHISFMQ